ncbi:hypothetical protein [Aquamicrobium terrae]
MNNDLKYVTFSPVFHWACVLMIVALFPVAALPFGIVKSALAALHFTLAVLAMLFSVGPEFVTRRDAVIANRYNQTARDGLRQQADRTPVAQGHV